MINILTGFKQKYLKLQNLIMLEKHVIKILLAVRRK
jgi:hypothetical protein